MAKVLLAEVAIRGPPLLATTWATLVTEDSISSEMQDVDPLT